MRRVVGLIALLIIIFGTVWLVRNGYDLAQNVGQETASDPAPAADEPVPLSGSGQETPASPGQASTPEGANFGAETASAPEQFEPSPMIEPETVDRQSDADDPSASSSTEIALAETDLPPTGEAGSNAAAPIGIIPTFDIVRVEPSGETVVAGLAAPEASVEILDGANPVAKAEANERGEWALVIEPALPAGTHDLAIRTTSPDKSKVTLSDQRIAISVPESGDEEPLVVLNAPDSPSRLIQVPPGAKDEDRLEVASAPDGGAPAILPETPAPVTAAESDPATPAVPIVGVAAIEAEPDGSLFVAGTATTSEPVRVYVDDELIGEVTPNKAGDWLVETEREAGSEDYLVRADQVSEATGAVIARAEVPFARESEVAAVEQTMASADVDDAEVSDSLTAPVTVVIKRGDNLWTISRETYGQGVRYSTIFQANRDQIRDPDWIYPGQVFVLPAGNSEWESE